MNPLIWDKISPDCYEGYEDGELKFLIRVVGKGRSTVAEYGAPGPFMKCFTLADAFRKTEEHRERMESILHRLR